jgi:hypothetical protein
MVQFNDQLSSEEIEIGVNRESDDGSDDGNILEKDLQILKDMKPELREILEDEYQMGEVMRIFEECLTSRILSFSSDTKPLFDRIEDEEKFL